jgi:hypothetical protein
VNLQTVWDQTVWKFSLSRSFGQTVCKFSFQMIFKSSVNFHFQTIFKLSVNLPLQKILSRPSTYVTTVLKKKKKKNHRDLFFCRRFLKNHL